MKSDEFSGKMLDDHIEVFCYCNFDYYRNLFWCFCISIYEKEKMTWAPRGSQEGRSTLSIIKFTRVAIEARMSKV